jgi:uncharacterized protein
MPTNLPPEYYAVEKRYKEAATPAEKAEALEELLSTIPKHKGTDHLRADLRRKLAKLKESVVEARKKGGSQAAAFHVEREGAGQVALVGQANTGKSSLLRALSNAEPEISPAPYTTWTPQPGMMVVNQVPIQLIDTPPFQPGYIEPELFNLLRRVDMLLIVVDLITDPVQQLEDTTRVLIDHRIWPRHLHTGEPEPRQVYLPALAVVNKCDTAEDEEVYNIFCALMETPWSCLPVSAVTGRNLDLLQQKVLNELHVIRVFSRVPGRDPDLTAPFVLKEGSTVADFARKVHKDFYEKMASARVWGSAQFDGQLVQRDYELQDGDIVELRL